MVYLPMDCPICSRRRLVPEIVTDDGVFVRSIKCEKCAYQWPEPTEDRCPECEGGTTGWKPCPACGGTGKARPADPAA